MICSIVYRWHKPRPLVQQAAHSIMSQLLGKVGESRERTSMSVFCRIDVVDLPQPTSVPLPVVLRGGEWDFEMIESIETALRRGHLTISESSETDLEADEKAYGFTTTSASRYSKRLFVRQNNL
jgi:hypothetical protein